MTREEMARLAAENIMGWVWVFPEGYRGGRFDDGKTTRPLWDPFTSDADCWALVCKLQASGWGFRLSIFVDGEVNARIYRYDPFCEHRESGRDRLAVIVRTCLRAVGVDVGVAD